MTARREANSITLRQALIIAIGAIGILALGILVWDVMTPHYDVWLRVRRLLREMLTGPPFAGVAAVLAAGLVYWQNEKKRADEADDRKVDRWWRHLEAVVAREQSDAPIPTAPLQVALDQLDENDPKDADRVALVKELMKKSEEGLAAQNEALKQEVAQAREEGSKQGRLESRLYEARMAKRAAMRTRTSSVKRLNQLRAESQKHKESAKNARASFGADNFDESLETEAHAHEVVAADLDAQHRREQEIYDRSLDDHRRWRAVEEELEQELKALDDAATVDDLEGPAV